MSGRRSSGPRRRRRERASGAVPTLAHAHGRRVRRPLRVHELRRAARV
jgi:hypothetical protein